MAVILGKSSRLVAMAAVLLVAGFVPVCVSLSMRVRACDFCFCCARVRLPVFAASFLTSPLIRRTLFRSASRRAWKGSFQLLVLKSLKRGWWQSLTWAREYSSRSPSRRGCATL